MRDRELKKKRKAMLLSHSPIAEPRESLVQDALSQGAPGLLRRALRKVLGLAETFGRGQKSETRSDRPPHVEAHPFRAPEPFGNTRRLSLALQGGGAFGAFTWGVLDRLLEEDDLELDAISGASAGAINAVLLASGLAKGGPDEARASLERFWTSVGESSARNLFLHPELVAATASQLSPSQFNPLELNPLRDLLAQEVDFEAIRTHSPVRLLVSATRVQDGAVRVFRTKAISMEVVLASACLPRLHHSVNIHGEAHWDGGYAANPPILPLVSTSSTSNLLVVHLIPTDHVGLPVTKAEIDKRVGQITFNGPLHKDLEAIALMKNLMRKEGEPTSRLGRKIDSVQLHHLSAENHVDGLSQASVLNTKWDFLSHLRDQGRVAAKAWLSDGFASTSVSPISRS
jgi:NTE family protein